MQCSSAAIVYTPRLTEFGRYDTTGTRPCRETATQTITRPRADGSDRTSLFCDACADAHRRFTTWLDEQVRLAPTRWAAPHSPEPAGTYLEIRYDVPRHPWLPGGERCDTFRVYAPGRLRLAHFDAPCDPGRDLAVAIASTGWELLDAPVAAVGRPVHVAGVRQIKPRPLVQPVAALPAVPVSERYRIRGEHVVIRDLADYAA